MTPKNALATSEKAREDEVSEPIVSGSENRAPRQWQSAKDPKLA
jgi:hypothetical protein